MAGRLENRVAVITGGTSGIGEATAELFVAEGASVVICGRSDAKGAAIADRLGDACKFITADVMHEADIAKTIEFAAETFGGIDILFNNAGGPTAGDITDVDEDTIRYAMQLLFSSAVLGIKHVVPHLQARGGGSIINNSSIAAIRDNQGGLLYSSAKAALTHYTQLAGVRLGPSGIRVNCISPGAIATPIFYGGSARANTLSDDQNATKMAKLEGNLANATPMQKTGLPVDIATGALYLASDEGRFVNSHDLIIDGGRTSMFHEPQH
ncbi:MAG: NAD(P)-dependent dehydrogenase (short-subunit alcohol dehydrogenase family) [Candidatus Azotimanducaceae bacterium]|jgi:NAD(P)-dependent dehydrogenase (short-subunit alcohol dehydrogenase family)